MHGGNDAFPLRRSIRFAPGVRLNLGKKRPVRDGRRARCAHHCRPRRTRTTVGVPVTGVSYTTTAATPPPVPEIHPPRRAHAWGQDHPLAHRRGRRAWPGVVGWMVLNRIAAGRGVGLGRRGDANRGKLNIRVKIGHKGVLSRRTTTNQWLGTFLAKVPFFRQPQITPRTSIVRKWVRRPSSESVVFSTGSGIRVGVHKGKPLRTAPDFTAAGVVTKFSTYSQPTPARLINGDLLLGLLA